MTASNRSGLRWLRRALLLAILLVIGAVAGLFYLGRAARPRRPTAEATSAIPAPAPEPSKRDVQVVTEGFEYEQQVEGKPVFKIRGDRMTTDRGGRVELEEVGLEIYRADQPFVLRSKRAVYDRETGEAQLEGSVELEGANSWAIQADRIDLVDAGKTVVSGSGGNRVHFRRGTELSGTAGALRFRIDDESLELSDGVEADGRGTEGGERLAIRAQSLLWQGDARTIDARGAVQLTWGRSRLVADAVGATLDAEQSGVESAEATGAVSGRFTTPEGEAITLEGASTLADFAAGAPERVDVRGDATAAARFRWSSRASERTLVAPSVAVTFAAGTPKQAKATGGVELEERPVTGNRRILRGQQLDVELDARGDLRTATASGGVELEEGELVATGKSVSLDGGGEQARLEGAPARAKSPRGQLQARRLVWNRSTQTILAEEGVRARFEPESSPLASSGTASGREPVDIEAKKGSFLEGKRGFLFEGQVQAVQGGSLLFCDRLEGDEASGTTIATGKVRTIWKDPAPAAGAADKGAPPAAAAETIATAESLTYKRGDGFLRYAGDVRVRQAPRELRASEVVVELAEDRRAERLKARGAVLMSDASSGQSATGDEADYDLQGRSAVVTGKVVALKDKGGNVLRGKRAEFDFATGSARLASGGS